MHDMAETLAPHLDIDRLEKFGLALADDLNPAGLDIRIVAGKSQPGLLHPWMGNSPFQVLLAAQNLEMQVAELVAEQLTDFDVGSPAHGSMTPAPRVRGSRRDRP